MKDIIREVDFEPYAHGGPKFHLTMWDTHNRAPDPRYATESYIGYMLTMDGVPLFTGEDFRPSPLHAIDSNESVKTLMDFLTLRPGDTDDEYFKDYNEDQLDFCSDHAEALDCCVMGMFERREEDD